MKVILLKTIQKVGKKDDIVDVAPGYAQHGLFPQKRAIPATPEAIATLNRHTQNVIAGKDMQHTLLDTAIKSLQDQAVIMPVKANKQGVLFSKIHEIDIAAFLAERHRISIDPTLLKLDTSPIKTLGEHSISVSDESFQSVFTITLVQE